MSSSCVLVSRATPCPLYLPRACRAPAVPVPWLPSASLVVGTERVSLTATTKMKLFVVAVLLAMAGGQSAPLTTQACTPQWQRQQATGSRRGDWGDAPSDDARRQAQRTGTRRMGNNAHRQHTPAVMHLVRAVPPLWRSSVRGLTGIPFVPSVVLALLRLQPWCLPRCSTRATPFPLHGAWVSLRPSRRAWISPLHCVRYGPANATSTEVTAGQVTFHSDCSHHFCLLLRPLFLAQLGHPG